MPQDSVAVLLINAADGVADLSLILSNHVGGQVAVRSIWDGKDLGVHSGVTRRRGLRPAAPAHAF